MEKLKAKEYYSSFVVSDENGKQIMKIITEMYKTGLYVANYIGDGKIPEQTIMSLNSYKKMVKGIYNTVMDNKDSIELGIILKDTNI